MTNTRIFYHYRTVKYYILILSFFLFSQFSEVLPQNNTLYTLPSIPQANQLNPAYINKCNAYIELPVISSVRVNVRNTGFGFHDGIHTDPALSEGKFFIDLDKLDRKLLRRNYFLTNLDIDLLGAGFRRKNWYYTFNVINHTALRITYPDDLVSIKDGNWNVLERSPQKISFNGLGVDLSIWNSIGISAATEWYEGLRLGARIKYLQGMANINTRKSRLFLNTLENPIVLEAVAQYRMNASFPMTLGYNDFGLINGINLDNSFDDIVGDYILNGNRGVAFDAGFEYDYDERTQIAASVVDLGFIRWKKNVNNFEATGNYTFSGIDLDSLQASPEQTDIFLELLDSLFQAFTAEGSTDPYFTMVPLQLYGSVTRKISSKLKVSAMTRIELHDANIRPSLSLSARYNLAPAVTASLSYNLMNNKYTQIGGGILVGNRITQFYLLLDNLPLRFTRLIDTPYFWPYNSRMVSLRFGLNLVFGCVKKQPKYKYKGHYRIYNGRCPAYW